MGLCYTWAVAAMLAALAASTCASLVRPSPGAGRFRARQIDTSGYTVVKRLPLEVLPSRYDISLTPYFEDEGDFLKNQFQGSVLIRAAVNGNDATSTDTITLHAASTLQFDKMDVDVVSHQSDKNTSISVTAVDREPASEMVTIRMEKAVSGDISINISYTGQLGEDMDGFYISTYQAGGQTRFLAATQFEATSARKAFPCFDEPALKAVFSLVVHPPAGYNALFNTDPIPDPVATATATTTNMKTLAKTPKSNLDQASGKGSPLSALLALRATPAAVADRSPVTFGATNPMSTYLVAFVVYHEDTFGAVVRDATETEGALRVWSRADLSGQRGYALQVGVASLEAYGRLFPDYFLHMNSKMDQVAIPDFSAGAMENWGLVTYRERGVLIDEQQSTTESRRYVVTTIAHELSHQWFGDLVSPDFWNVLWLNEGFATYWSYHADLGSITEGWRLRDQFLVEEMSAALETDSAADTHAMTTPENTTAPFDDITYSKGGAILRMFSNWLGEDVFYERLNDYLNSHEYSSAQPADLFASLSPGDETLRSYMQAWTSTAGYPVINVTRGSGWVLLEQDRYQLTPATVSQAAAPWPILVSFNNGPLDSRDSVDSVWLLEGQRNITVDLSNEEPLFLNYNWTGFYRVNYDADGWQAAQQQLTSDHLVVPRETRAQLISDAFSLARSDHLGYQQALDLSRYLNKEEDYLPWGVAFRAFDFLDTALAPTTYYSSFKAYMQQLLERPYAAVRFAVLPDDDPVTRLLRVSVLRHSCRYGSPQCLQAAKDLAGTSSAGGVLNAGSVQPDLRSTAYCVWAQNQELWDMLWQRYLETTVATEKVELLTALGCSQNETTLKQFLTRALDVSLVRVQDWGTVYAGVCSTPAGLKVATEFIGQHADGLNTQPSELETIISTLARKVVAEDQLDKLKALSSVEGLAAVNSTLQGAIAAAEQQVAWSEAHVTEVGRWLDGAVHVPAAGAVPGGPVAHAPLLLVAIVGGATLSLSHVVS